MNDHRQTQEGNSTAAKPATTAARKSRRVAAIDWMRGLVMVLMVIDHVSMAFGEFPTDWVWDPPGSSSPLAALTMANYGTETMIIKYPLFPWLAFSALELGLLCLCLAGLMYL